MRGIAALVRRYSGWLGAVAIVGGVGAVGAGQVRSQQIIDQQRELIERVERDEEVAVARACVNAWEGRGYVRDMGEEATRRASQASTRALIRYAGARPAPEDVARFAQIAAEEAETEVAAVRATLPDPECDLDAARSSVGG